MKYLERAVLRAAVPLAVAAGLSLSPALAKAAPSNTNEPETDGIIITLDEQTSRSLQSNNADALSLLADTDVMRDLEAAGLSVEAASTSSDGTTQVTAEPTDSLSDAEALEAVQYVDGVEAVQYNFVYHLVDFIDGEGAADTATNNGTSLLAALSVNDPIAQISAPDTSRNPKVNQYWAYHTNLADAWADAASDHAVTVATLDSGCDLDHEDLRGNVLTDLAWDETSDTPLKNCAVQDSASNGHGTMVAGVIAAVANNGRGIAGASNNANVLPVKVVQNDGNITSADLCDAYDYLFETIDSGRCTTIRAVNMSLGAYGDVLGEDSALHSQVKKALDEYDILTVCSGGNSKGSTTPRTDPMYPSDLDEVISVTSLDTDGTNTYLSDYNMAKDISAPGERIYSTKPHDVYDEESGTSLAAPIVSGSIALLYASEPDATADDIREALYESADAIVDPDNDRSAVSGSHGALNTDAALDYLDDLVEPEPDPEPEPADLPFTDVFQGTWYYNSVAFVYKNGIMGGYTGTTLFGTEDPIYREQLAQLLYNYMGNGEIAPAAPQFDVNQNEYYHKAVNWAVSNGIMNGYTEADGSSIRFGVGDVLTREQLASVFANIARRAGDTADATKFNSMSDHIYTTAWARDNLIWAVDKGVINGVETDSGIRYLNPLGICKRCEAAAIVHNCIENGLL